jgi:hypothetical protein
MSYIKFENLDTEEAQEVWCVIREIKKTLNIRYPVKSILVSPNLENRDMPISPAKVQQILEELQRKKILKINSKSNKIAKDLNAIPIKIIDEKKFNDEYEEAKKKNKSISLEKSQKVESIKETKLTNLYLTPEGDLYRKPKTKYCYEIEEKSDRHKIVRFLTENRGYQSIGLIAVELADKNKKSLRTEIGKMRDKIKNRLKIDGKDFLQSKKGSGYRINPKYKIILKNE